MKQIFVIHEGDEIITTRDTMENAVAACMNRMSICGYLCEGFNYSESTTIIIYRDPVARQTRAMYIDCANYKEGI